MKVSPRQAAMELAGLSDEGAGVIRQLAVQLEDATEEVRATRALQKSIDLVKSERMLEAETAAADALAEHAAMEDQLALASSELARTAAEETAHALATAELRRRELLLTSDLGAARVSLNRAEAALADGLETKYDLVACVCHHGKGMDTGHYSAICANPRGDWLRYNDGKVAVVPPEELEATHRAKREAWEKRRLGNAASADVADLEERIARRRLESESKMTAIAAERAKRRALLTSEEAAWETQIDRSASMGRGGGSSRDATPSASVLREVSEARAAQLRQLDESEAQLTELERELQSRATRAAASTVRVTSIMAERDSDSALMRTLLERREGLAAAALFS
jgi:hypothetical protein